MNLFLAKPLFISFRRAVHNSKCHWIVISKQTLKTHRVLSAEPYINDRIIYRTGMPYDGGLSSFLLPPFRKPKRIRTAFSPGQLLKLEQAFEKNHYVVGAERKQLASGLGLSETQVKVWFQNRRTKHKRQKQEDEEQGSSGGTGAKEGNSKSDDDDEEEEDIDMEDNEESDSSSNELLINSDLKPHQLWYQAIQSTKQQSSPVSASTPPSLSSLPSSAANIWSANQLWFIWRDIYFLLLIWF